MTALKGWSQGWVHRRVWSGRTLAAAKENAIHDLPESNSTQPFGRGDFEFNGIHDFEMEFDVGSWLVDI
jgi:hypothetical protein